MDDMLSKTLVTGASGMVGSYVDFGIKTTRRSLDVLDLKEVLVICNKYKPKVILHLAAETDVDRCERDPEYAYAVNTIGTYNMAVAAKELGAKLVYVSTVYIFDGERNEPYTEDDEPNPQNFYSRSKYLGELIIKGMLYDYLILRADWMMGGGSDKDQKFVAKIISQLGKEEIKAVNDRFGSITYAKDLVNRIKEYIMADKKGVFHAVNEGCCSRYEMASEIAHILGSLTKVKSVDSSAFPADAQRGTSFCAKSLEGDMRPWKSALKDYLESEWQ